MKCKNQDIRVLVFIMYFKQPKYPILASVNGGRASLELSGYQFLNTMFNAEVHSCCIRNDMLIRPHNLYHDNSGLSTFNLIAHLLSLQKSHM